MIRLQKVDKYFNRRKANEIHVINDTSLNLPDTGIVALLGPSGCGKTTLLNAIGGLDKINSGRIFIDDDCITGRGANKIDTIRNAKIGYIFQNFNLMDNRTVFDNVAVALKMVGIKDKKVIEDRVKYCLESVGIYPFRNRTADALSGGQRQRVAIARAIVKNPRIIIADEPTGNLDSANTIAIMNIIKTISKDRLVLLVTHEKEIAEFYAERIIELKDGKVVDDRTNDNAGSLDYQLENKIYLKDLPVHQSFQDKQVKLNVYGDKERAADIKMVLRGGNLYIDTGGKFNVVDERANIELIDDHYTALDSSIYEETTFEYDRHLPNGFKAKYTSIYTLWNMIGNGFKTVAGFKALKKLLLLGFVFAAAFTFVATSNIFGILKVEEKDFLTTNSHYITVSNPKHDESMLTQVRKMENSSYVTPGDTRIQVTLPMNDYYQTASASMNLTGSLTHTEELVESDIVEGRLPENEKEIVIDKMILDKFLKAGVGNAIGLTEVGQFVGRTITVPNLPDYTIVGVSDTTSPSIFFAQNQTMYVLANAPAGTDESDEYSMYNMMDGFYTEDMSEDEDGMKIVDYALRSDGLTIKRGSAPKNAYEVIVNNMHYEDEDYKIGKTIKKKVNGHNLTVVGFYTSDYDYDYLYVDTDTMRQEYIGKQKVFSVYTNDTDAMMAELEDAGLTAKVNYDRDRASYLKEHRASLRSALVVAAIILLIALVEMFLMLRSSFLSRIKEVGTLRAIGLKKRDIYRMFTGEILVITVLTSIPGIAIAYYLLYLLTNAASYYASNYVLNPAVAGIAFAVMIVFNLIVGLIPVFRTMRKTPAAILARTDI